LKISNSLEATSADTHNHRLRNGQFQISRLTSSFAPISYAASMRGRKKSPSQNQPLKNNRRTPNEGDTIWRM